MDQRFYFDSAGLCPIHPEVLVVYEEALKNVGNPNAIHLDGQRARKLLEESREKIAQICEVNDKEVIFTSGATESNNLALFNIRKWLEEQKFSKLISSQIEHKSVLVNVEKLAKDYDVEFVKISEAWAIEGNNLNGVNLGRVGVFQQVNSEIGIILQLDSVRKSVDFLFSDAAAGLGHVKLPDADLITITSSKIGGPQGIGALIGSGIKDIEAEILGGGQEFNKRSGTQNVAGAVAFAKALEIANRDKEQNFEKYRSWTKQILKELSEVELVGVPFNQSNEQNRTFHIISLLLPKFSGEELLYKLDQKNISISLGSACNQGVIQPSETLKMLGYNDFDASRAIRVSFSHINNQDQIDYLIQSLAEVIRNS